MTSISKTVNISIPKVVKNCVKRKMAARLTSLSLSANSACVVTRTETKRTFVKIVMNHLNESKIEISAKMKKEEGTLTDFRDVRVDSKFEVFRDSPENRKGTGSERHIGWIGRC